jgi:hypothetical protein
VWDFFLEIPVEALIEQNGGAIEEYGVEALAATKRCVPKRNCTFSCTLLKGQSHKIFHLIFFN